MKAPCLAASSELDAAFIALFWDAVLIWRDARAARYFPWPAEANDHEVASRIRVAIASDLAELEAPVLIWRNTGEED